MTKIFKDFNSDDNVGATLAVEQNTMTNQSRIESACIFFNPTIRRLLTRLRLGLFMYAVTLTAMAQIANEDITYPRSTTPNQLSYQNQHFNARNGSAIIEVYALGGGGGGQGGHSYEGSMCAFRCGTGGAGGGGSTNFMRFTATVQTTFDIIVGNGGTGGSTASRNCFQAWSSGGKGYDGGTTIVSKVDGKTPNIGNLIAAGGIGGGGSERTNVSGGNGGAAASSRPVGITSNDDWQSRQGGKGGDGYQNEQRESRGGNAATLNIGTLSSFGGGAGGYNYNFGNNTGGQYFIGSCSGYSRIVPGTGAGGSGAYNSANSGPAGGNGQVRIRVIYLHEVTFLCSERGNMVLSDKEYIPNGTSFSTNNKNLPTPIRAGYRFDGWWTATSGGSQWTPSTIFSTSTTTAERTLYARWTPNINLVSQGTPFYQWGIPPTVTLNWSYTYLQNTQTTPARFWIYRRQTVPSFSEWELRNQTGIGISNGTNITSSYPDNVEFGRTYEYRIVLHEGTNQPLPDYHNTTPLRVTIPNISTTPTLPPWSVTARGENDRIEVSFPADNRLTSGTFTLERRKGTTGYFTTILERTLNGLTYYTHTDGIGSDPCNSYQYQVTINAFGGSLIEKRVSDEVRTTGVLQFDDDQPFKASKGEHINQVQLEWIVEGQNQTIPETYRVFRRIAGSNAAWDERQTVTSSARIVYWNDNNVFPGVYYEYEVRSYQICNKDVTQLQTRRDIGFAQDFGTVLGQVTYGEKGTAVEGVNILARRNVPEGESQFYSLRSPGGGQRLDFSSIRVIGATNQWTLQFWVRPDGANTGTVRIGTLGAYQLQMSSVTDGYQIHTDGGGSRSATIPANQWSHVTLTRNGNTWNIFVVNDQDRDNIFIQNTSYTNSLATATVFDLGWNFSGHIDDLRFWNRPLTETNIMRDYSRRLVGNENGLRGYWTFDENLTGYAFDMSHSGSGFNGNHATTNTLEFSTIVPDEEYQLALKAITDQQGNYTINGIPYTGNGTQYSIIPTLENYQYKHQFYPQQLLLNIRPSSLIHHGIDFENISSFPVTGRVLFANSNYPVEGVTISVNGQPAFKNGEPVTTRPDGTFDVDVRIGDNYITLSKPGHVFANGGRFPASGLHNFQLPLHYTRNAELNFIDNTTVRLAGRVVGGQRETDLPLGFGLSKANIGQATVTLETLNDYSPNTTGSDLTVAGNIGGKESKTVIKTSGVIEITTNAETGEFVAILPPVPFRIAGAKNWEFEDMGAEDNNFTYSPRRRLTPFSIDPTSLKTVTYGGQNFAYHDSIIITRFNPPSMNVHDLWAEPGAFGDKIFRYLDNVVPENSRNVPLYRKDEATGNVFYELGHPVFTQAVGNYTWEISAFEEYFDGKNPIPDRVPLAGLPVTVDNGFASHKLEVFPDGSSADVLTYEERRLALDAEGKVNYRFVAGFPKLAGDHLLSATVSIIQNGITYYWDKNNSLASTTPVDIKGYVLGIRPIDGNNFVTQGPDHVEIVLNDPPGSNSHAYLERGSSMITEVTNTFQFDTNNEIGTTRHMGLDVSVDVSIVFIGSSYNRQSIYDETTGTHWAQSYMNGNTNVAVTSFTEQIPTSSSPDFIGAMADVYIGKSTNYVFGKTRNLSLYPAGQAPANATIGTDGLKLYTKEITAVGQEFHTQFTYTQNSIVNMLLPNITQLRDNLINTDYYSAIPPIESVNFGNNNALYFSKVPKGDDDFGIDGSYVVYFAPNTPFRIDMVAEYNQWIENWKQIIADNERKKVGLFNSRSVLESRGQMRNRSFDSGVGPIIESKTVSFDGTELSYFMSSTGLYNEGSDGVLNNGNGKVTNIKFSDNEIREFMGIETESNELTFGFVLDTDGINDALTVDIYHPVTTEMMQAVMPDNSMRNLHGYTFRRMAGQTSCPHEAEERSLFFQPNQHIINNGTFKVENPELYINGTAKSATIANIPNGSETSFTIKLHNMSEINRTVSYQLRVEDMSNPNGLIISIDGTPLTSPRNYTIPFGNALEKLVVIRQSSLGILNYENIKLVLGSNCDDNIFDEVTFTVRFTPTFVPITVTFDSSGGSEVVLQEINAGELAVEPAKPTKKGHAFIGWFKGNNQFDFNTPITENITLTAKWVLYGDVNDDGGIEFFDASIVARNVAGWNGYELINTIAADVDLNGDVEFFDASIIARHVAGWNGYESFPYIETRASQNIQERSRSNDIPTIRVPNETGKVGDIVEVPISLENNPGIVTMQLNVAYNDSALKLIGVTDAKELGLSMHTSDLSKYPYPLSWWNGLSQTDFNSNGVIATLRFELLAEVDNAPITVTCSPGNIRNKVNDIINFNVVNGSVSSETGKSETITFVDPASKAVLRTYPNPVLRGTTLNLEGVAEGSIIEVYNMIGTCVYRTIAVESPASFVVNVPAGVYIVRTNSGAIRIVVINL